MVSVALYPLRRDTYLLPAAFSSSSSGLTYSAVPTNELDRSTGPVSHCLLGCVWFSTPRGGGGGGGDGSFRSLVRDITATSIDTMIDTTNQVQVFGGSKVRELDVHLSIE